MFSASFDSSRRSESLSDRMQQSLVSRVTAAAGGNRTRGKYSLLCLVLLLFLLFAWLSQGYEKALHDSAVRAASSSSSSSSSSTRPTLSPTTATVPIIYYPPTEPAPSPPAMAPTAMPPSAVESSRSDSAPTSSSVTQDGEGDTTSAPSIVVSFQPTSFSSSTYQPTIFATSNSTNSTSEGDTTKSKKDPFPTSDSMLTFWLSLMFSLFTWLLIIQIIRYLRRPYRRRANEFIQQHERGQIELINQLIILNHSHNSSLSQRLRLAMLNRDFTADDYEMLSQLDEVRFGGTGTGSRRRGASQNVINQMPTHKVTEEELSEWKNTGKESSCSCCNICLAPYELGDEVRTVLCLHKFHKDCIDNWLKMNAVCPICKYSIIRDDESQ